MVGARKHVEEEKAKTLQKNASLIETSEDFYIQSLDTQEVQFNTTKSTKKQLNDHTKKHSEKKTFPNRNLPLLTFVKDLLRKVN